MATEVSRGDATAFAVVGRAQQKNRAQQLWGLISDWPVLPVIMLLILIVMALMADTPF